MAKSNENTQRSNVDARDSLPWTAMADRRDIGGASNINQAMLVAKSCVRQ
jgi:hypothetical protein